MEDVLVWLFWAAIIGGSIASSASKAKKQRDEQARKAAAAKAAKARAAAAKSAQTTMKPVSTTVRPTPDAAKPVIGGSFGRLLEELSRQLTEQPTATSHDYRSLEQDYDAMDGREYRGDWSAESMEDEVTAYERLAQRRAGRLSPAAAAISTAGASAGAYADASVGASATTAAAAQESTTDRTDNDRPTTLQELLGDDFDLRRAVIEAEILTPKYAAGY